MSASTAEGAGRRFLALVLHPTEPRALFVREGGAWGLPGLTPGDGFFAVTTEVNAFVCERLGLEASVLRCLRPGRSEGGARETIFVLEPRASAVLPAGARWASLDELPALRLAGPEWLEPIVGCLRQDAGHEPVPARRAPWARRGWRTEAEAWVCRELAGLGRVARSGLDQRKQWSITSLWRVATDQGQVYFKAVPPLFGGEAGITRVLGELFGPQVPPVLASEPARGWMLLEDFGGRTLRELADGGASLRLRAVRQYAELQIASLDHRDAVRAAGCLDRRLSVLDGQLHALLHEAEELSLLSAEERTRLRRLEPALRRAVAELAACEMPDTLVHGDFHFGNIAACEGERLVFFDWTDGCLSQPMFDPVTLGFFGLGGTEWREIQDAYLAPWRELVPPERLQRAFALTETVGRLHHAVSYQHIREGQEPDARWELEGFTAQLLKKVLELAVA